MNLPVGTRVIVQDQSRIGIVDDTNGPYRVRFPDGETGDFPRDMLTVFKSAQAAIPGALDPASLYRYVVYGCVIGSQAYGLANVTSDVDRRGFFIPPADLHWSLTGVPEQIESDDEQVYWEIGKFIRLALKANPNIIEVLFSPLVEVCKPEAQDLIANRSSFLSKRVYQTYNAYSMSQFKKLEQDIRNHGTVKWKHAMHLIRLQIAGCSILRSGEVTLDTGSNTDRLLAIRRGEISWQEVDAWRIELHHQFDQAYKHSPLPAEPDFDLANALLINARRVATNLTI